MNGGTPPTARKARTGLLTPPGISSRARSNSTALVAVVSAWSSGVIERSCLREQPRSLLREVGQDDVGARAPDGRAATRSMTRSSSSQPARAAALIIAYSPDTLYAATGTPKRSFTRRDDVEVRQRGLHHHDVGALLEIERDLAQRLARVARVHLVAAAVAERGRGLGRLAERAVEAGRVLGGVRQDRRRRSRPARRARRGSTPTRPSIMPDGATTSRPGVRVDDAGRGERGRSVASLSTSTSPSAAVAIGRSARGRCTRRGRRRPTATAQAPRRGRLRGRVPQGLPDRRRRGRLDASRRGCRRESRLRHQDSRACGIPRPARRRSGESNRASSQSPGAHPRPRTRTAAQSVAGARAASREPGPATHHCAAAAAADARGSSRCALAPRELPQDGGRELRARYASPTRS